VSIGPFQRPLGDQAMDAAAFKGADRLAAIIL
jgi:hypothetical protein